MDNSVYNKSFKDKRGREWELFSDVFYYHMACVRPVGDRNFNSQLSFHFDRWEDGENFAELIKRSS